MAATATTTLEMEIPIKRKSKRSKKNWKQFIKNKISNPAPYPPPGLLGTPSGLAGNLTSRSLEKVFSKICSLHSPLPLSFLDIGSGEGCPIVAGLLEFGFSSCYGIEICKEVAEDSIRSITSFLPRDFGVPWEIKAGDIEHYTILPPHITVVYRFWTGMPCATMAHIMHLVLRSPSVQLLAVSIVRRGGADSLVGFLKRYCYPHSISVKYGKSSHTFLICDLHRALTVGLKVSFIDLCLSLGSFSKVDATLPSSSHPLEFSK